MESLPGNMDFTMQPVAAYSAYRSSGGPLALSGYGNWRDMDKLLKIREAGGTGAF